MSQTIAQKCKAVGISLPTYYQRIQKGMTPEQALSTPLMRKRNKYHNLPQATPQEADPEPLPPPEAVLSYRNECVFESDFQRRHREASKNIAKAKRKKEEEQPKTPSKAVHPVYGPIKPEITTEDISRFNKVCGGYTAVILNHAKEGEFKYQIVATDGKTRQYTNNVIKFINSIIKICDPEGKTPFRVIER